MNGQLCIGETPATLEGQQWQRLVNYYCLAFGAFSLVRFINPSDHGFQDLLHTAVLFLANHNVSYIFVTFFVVLSLFSLMRSVNHLGLLHQRSIPFMLFPFTNICVLLSLLFLPLGFYLVFRTYREYKAIRYRANGDNYARLQEQPSRGGQANQGTTFNAFGGNGVAIG